MEKIDSFFVKQAKTHPHSIAIKDAASSLSYSQLHQSSNAFARYLYKNFNICHGDYIPILASDKTIEMFVAILGILKCGAAYVPINLKSSPHQIRQILSATQSKCMVFASSKPENFEMLSIPTISLSQREQLLKDFSTEDLPRHNGDSYTAYVAFTSGTTGNSKGVLVSHANIIATYESWKEVYQYSHHDRHLQMANISFDVFTGDWVRSLCSGGTLILCSNNLLLQPDKLYQLMKCEKITCAEFVPSTINRLVNYCQSHKLLLKDARLIISGSDVWLTKDYWQAKQVFNKQTRVINSYGTAETTIDSCYFEASTGLAADSTLTSLSVPIGKPFPHVNMYVLNDKKERVKPTETGEIYIGGKGVSMGYLSAPELTAERFVVDPFVKEGNALMYRTGDLGSITSDGNIVFSGRNQFQVKVHGKRIELADVEGIISSHPKVHSAVIVPLYQENNATQLSAYLKLTDKNLTYYEIISYLREYLPYYSMPNRVFEVSDVSLTLNGKIDNKATVKNTLREILPQVEEPFTPLETKITKIWKEVLLVNSIGVTNKFCEMGGTSLLYLSLIDKIKQNFNVNLPIEMEFSTVRSMATYIQADLNKQKKNKAQSFEKFSV